MPFLNDFRIEEFMAHGAASVSFRAADLRCEEIGIHRLVGLQFFWRLDQARRAARRLADNASVYEICGLTAYAELPTSEARVFLEPALNRLNGQLGLNLKTPDTERVGALVLRLIEGEPLIRRGAILEEPTPAATSWLVHFRHPKTGRDALLRESLSPFARNLSAPARLRITAQLARALAESHGRGITHGDLNPANVICDPQSLRVALIDLGRDHFGVRGWQAPEHFQLMAGEIDALPPAADVYLLGLWLRRLLPQDGPWSGWTELCLAKDPKNRPEAKWLADRLERARLLSPGRRVGLALAGAAVLLASFWLGRRSPHPLPMPEEGFARIAVLPFDGDPAGLLAAEMASVLLNADPALEAVRFSKARNAAKGLARYFEEPLDTRLALASEALGGRYALGGKVTEAAYGRLSWRGLLCARSGECRPLSANAVSGAQLAERVAAASLQALGLTRSPAPVHDFYSANDRANTLYSEASELLLNGRINAALALFDKALNVYDPNFHWALVRKAECHIRRNELAIAERTLTALIKLADAQENSRLTLACCEGLARIYAKRLDRASAAAYLSKGKALCNRLGLSLRLADFILLEAHQEAALGQTQPSLEAVSQALAIYRANDDQIGALRAWLAQAYVHAEQGELDQAGTALNRAEALAATRRLDYFSAKTQLERVRLRLYANNASEPQSTLALLAQARETFHRSGDRSQILLVDYFGAIYDRIRNKCREASTTLAAVRETALESGDKALATQASLSWSDALSVLGKKNKAAQILIDLSESLDTLPIKTQFDICTRIWRFHADKNQFEDATFFLKKSIDIADLNHKKKDKAYALNNMGELFERKGAFDIAVDHYQRSLRIKRGLNDRAGIVWTLRNLAVTALKQGDLARASEYGRELARMDEPSLRTGLILARLHYEHGRYQKALSTLAVFRAACMEQGRWRQPHESLYAVFARAAEARRRFEPPDQFGNWP